MVAVRHDGAGSGGKRRGVVTAPKKTYTPPAQVFQQAGSSMRQGQTPAQYYAPAPVYQQPANFGTSGGGISQGFAAPAQSFPSPPPAPPRMSENDWLAGDSEYTSQQNEYNRALKLFTDRIDKKKKMFDDDYNQSAKVTDKNQGQAMTGVGEDFAARGMAYSGLFDSARTDTEDMFKRQRGNLELVKNRNRTQADDDLADYGQEIELSRGNARRNALARFANSQNLF